MFIHTNIDINSNAQSIESELIDDEQSLVVSVNLSSYRVLSSLQIAEVNHVDRLTLAHGKHAKQAEKRLKICV